MNSPLVIFLNNNENIKIHFKVKSILFSIHDHLLKHSLDFSSLEVQHFKYSMLFPCPLLVSLPLPSFFILSVVNTVVLALISEQSLWMWPMGARIPRFILKILSELEVFPTTFSANIFPFENTSIYIQAFNLGSLFSAITYRVFMKL